MELLFISPFINNLVVLTTKINVMSPIKILLVEDSEGDIFLIKDAINDAGIALSIDVARNGQEAVQFLNKIEIYKEKETPDLILLDINMPVMNGHEFLDFVKGNEKFKHLPIIILTTSSSKNDILKSYQKYSNSYIVKPNIASDFDVVVKGIENFWINTAKLPGNNNG